MDEKSLRLAVDANGYVWWVYGDAFAMVSTNPDNSPIPFPVTYYEPVETVDYNDHEPLT